MSDEERDELLVRMFDAIRCIKKCVCNVAPVRKEEAVRVRLTGALRLEESRRRVLQRAIDQELIGVREDGTLEWLGETLVALSFLCGRLWSHDRVVRGRWRKGEKAFPAAPLQRLFHVENMKQSRQHGLDNYLTDEEQDIYDLFVE